MNRWLAFDAWLIGKFEKFTHWFQRWTGKTNYFLCAVCAWAIIATVVVEYAAIRVPKGESIGVIGVVLILVILLHVSYLLPREERHIFEHIQDGVANPRKRALGNLGVRFILLTLVSSFVFFVSLNIFVVPGSKPVSPSAYFTASAYTALLFHEYFCACDPLPPCKGRVWNEISAFFAKPAVQKEN